MFVVSGAASRRPEPHAVLYLVGDDASPDDPKRPGGRQDRQDCTCADCSQDVVVAFEHLGLPCCVVFYDGPLRGIGEPPTLRSRLRSAFPLPVFASLPRLPILDCHPDVHNQCCNCDDQGDSAFSHSLTSSLLLHLNHSTLKDGSQDMKGVYFFIRRDFSSIFKGANMRDTRTKEEP